MSALTITCPICGDKILVPATMGKSQDGQVDTYIDSASFMDHVAAHSNGHARPGDIPDQPTGGAE